MAPSEIFQALGDVTRLRIVRLLVTTGEESCLCELVDSLLEPQYNLSRHLKQLRQCGLLASTKDGRWVYHRLVDGPRFLRELHKAIGNVPDNRRVFAADLARFRSRLRLRQRGRCRVGAQTRFAAQA